MAKDNIVSVVIPTYNRAEFLTASIDSVLTQKLPDGWQMEVIVADDGSTDNTEKVVSKYGQKVKYMKAPHTGLSAVVRNIGIKASSGELIAFQDSDDKWLPGKLLKQIPVFEDPKVTIVHGGIVKMGEKKSKKNSGKLTSTSFDALLRSNVAATMTVVARAKVLKDLGGFSEDPALRGIEDYYLWLMVGAKKANVIKCLDDILGEHRVHTESLSYDGFRGLDETQYQVKALRRIVTAIEHVLSDSRVTEQIELIEEALVRYAEMIFITRNPMYVHYAPKISVVLPMYNCERFIEKSIKSILNQTFTDFELIAIDDGSKDKTAEIVRNIDDPRIKLIRQRNKGLLRTDNKGITISRGTFIARQDADDISMPSRFEKQVMYLISNKSVGMVSCYYTQMDEANESLGITQTFPFKPIDVKRSLYLVNPITHGGTMTRREIFEKIGLYQPSHEPIEDYKAWCDMADISDVAIIPESLYWYRISRGGISATQYDESIQMPRRIAEEQWHKPLAHKKYRHIVKDGKYYRSLESPFANSIYNLYMSQQKALAKKMLRRGHLISGTVTALAVFRLPKRKVRVMARKAASRVKYTIKGKRKR